MKSESQYLGLPVSGCRVECAWADHTPHHTIAVCPGCFLCSSSRRVFQSPNRVGIAAAVKDQGVPPSSGDQGRIVYDEARPVCGLGFRDRGSRGNTLIRSVYLSETDKL